VGGYVPIHYRDAATTANHYVVDIDRDGSSASDADDSDSDTAYGLPVSIDANPSWRLVAANIPACVSDCGGTLGWGPDLAHQSSFAHVAYLTTGNYYYLEEMQFWAAYNVMFGNDGLSQTYHRHGSWGILTSSIQARGVGWGLRNIAAAARYTPDGDDLKEYFQHKVETTTAAFEGFLGVRGGLNYRKLTNAPDETPCPTSGGTNDGKAYSAFSAASYDPDYSTPYCFGRRLWLTMNDDGDNPLSYPHPDSDAWESGWAADYTVSSAVQDHYFWMGFIAARDMGFATEDVLRESSKMALNMLDRRDEFNHLAYGDGYRRPRGDDTDSWFRSWKDFYDAYPAAYKALEAWDSNYDVQNGYAISTLAISSFFTEFVDGPARGWDLWDWIHNEENMANSTTYQTGPSTGVYDYKWAFVPRRDPTRVKVVEPGDTFFILRYVAPTTAACTIKVDDNSDFGSPVVNASDGLSTREREYKATGLTASSEYYWRIACADDPYNSGNTDSDGTLSTLATLSGTADLNVWVGQGQSTTYLDYDQDGAAPWGNTTSESCTTGCTLAAAGISKGHWYYRIRHADGAVGAVHQTIVQ